MATFISKDVVDELIAANGDDPEAPWEPVRAVKIVEYDSRGGKVWGVIYRMKTGQVIEDEGRYEEETDFVRNPKVIWERR
jgi:hypothetical protein